MSGDLDAVNISALQQKQAQVKSERAEARQETATESFLSACEEAFNPWAADAEKKKMRTLEDRKPSMKEVLQELKAAGAASSLDEAALRFQKKNPELNAKSLIKLLQSLNKDDSQEEIIKKVLSYFPDKSLADEAFDFLIENSTDEILENLKGTKENFNKQFGREIIAGKNIATQAREFSGKGLGSPTDLRDLYRDITGNPREPNILFTQLSQSYDFQQLKTVIQFLLHAMGGDLKSKGPSIDPGELSRLFTETRSLQAILGVYRFFQSRMGLLNQMFAESGVAVPKTLTFEQLAESFMKQVEDRYPAGAKVTMGASQLGVAGQKPALIAVISQWRDAIRSISPRLFKTIQARDATLAAIIEALTSLEEEEEIPSNG